MTLSFSTKWGKQMGDLAGTPNYFIEKIWAGIPNNEEAFSSVGVYADEGITTHKGLYYSKYMYLYKRQFGAFWDGHSFHGQTGIKSFTPKLHTIRPDPSNRWKPGAKIHFVINNRTKDRFQFAPIVEVKSVQEIVIKKNNTLLGWEVLIDGRKTRLHDIGDHIPAIENLARNDGFNSVEDFFRFFNTDFSGKIIHWTNKTY